MAQTPTNYFEKCNIDMITRLAIEVTEKSD